MNDKLNVMERIKRWVGRMGGEPAVDRNADPHGLPVIDLTADYVDGRDRLRDMIVLQLVKLAKRPRMAAGKALAVYLDDTYNYQQAVAFALGDYIGTYIEANSEWQFSQYQVRLGMPELNDVAVPVARGISIALRLPVTERDDTAGTVRMEHRVSYPAVIKVLDGHGSLLDPQVELLPIDGKVYNIGYGRVMVIGSKVRTNDIPVSDDQQSPMFRYNRFVSREHARIVYKAGKGYYLFSHERGTPLHGKRTEISRDSKVIRLDTPRTGQRLQDGDSIILNRNVILTFCERKPQLNV